MWAVGCLSTNEGLILLYVMVYTVKQSFLSHKNFKSNIARHDIFIKVKI